jgi:hypothetical protein
MERGRFPIQLILYCSIRHVTLAASPHERLGPNSIIPFGVVCVPRTKTGASVATGPPNDISMFHNNYLLGVRVGLGK